jgi:hypothetical protein
MAAKCYDNQIIQQLNMVTEQLQAIADSQRTDMRIRELLELFCFIVHIFIFFHILKFKQAVLIFIYIS